MSRGVRNGRAGFTIIELMVAVMVGLMMLGLAVPSMRGVLDEQRLREKLALFEDVVRRSAALASKSKKEVRLIWFKDGLRALTDWDQFQQPGPVGNEAPRWEQGAGGEESVFFAVGEDEGEHLDDELGHLLLVLALVPRDERAGEDDGRESIHFSCGGWSP